MSQIRHNGDYFEYNIDCADDYFFFGLQILILSSVGLQIRRNGLLPKKYCYIKVTSKNSFNSCFVCKTNF